MVRIHTFTVLQIVISFNCIGSGRCSSRHRLFKRLPSKGVIILYFVLELIVIGYGYLQYSESPKCRLSDIDGMSPL